MAGPVKGTWGGEDIELNDAATETTLLLILDAMNRMAKSGGGSGGSGDAAKDVKDLADKSKEAGDQVEELGETAEETSSKLANGFGIAFDAVKGLATELLIGGDRLSDFTSHITGAISEIPLIGGFLGGASQAFVSVIDSTIDNFRELSQSGIGFGESLFDIQAAAAKSGLSLETFQQTLSNNSETLALFGGSATAGAKRFQEVSGIVQKQGEKFSALGMTMEETAQFTADYMEMQIRLGRNNRMSAQQQAMGTAAYIKQLDYLAKVTGKQRSEVAAMLKEQATDKRLKLIMGSMSEAAQANLQGTLAMMDGASPELKDAITEMVATGGVPMSDMAKDMARLNPRLASMAKGLRDGTVSQEAYAAEVRRTAEGVNNMSDAQRQQYAVLQAQGSAIGSSVVLFQDLTKFGEGAADALDDQQKRMNAGNNSLLDFERRITQVRNLILGSLIESGVFQSLEGAFADVIDLFTSDDSVGQITSMVQKFADAFKVFIADFSRYSFSEMFDKYVLKPIKNLIFGTEAMSPEEIAAKQSSLDSEATTANNVITNIEGNEEYKSLLALKEQDKELTGEQQKKLSDFENQLKTARQQIVSITAEQNSLGEAAKGSSGLLGGLMDNLNIPWGKIAVGIGIAAAAIVGIGTAISIMAPGLAVASPGLLALGVAFAGVGVAGAGIAMLIDSIAESFGKVARGIKEFESIDPGTIESVGTGLKPLADVLVDLAKGGIVASFVGEGALENLSAGLKSFEQVDYTVLPQIGYGIEAMSGPITGLAKAGFFAGFVSDGVLEKLAAGVKSFEGLDVNQLWLMGPALKSLNEGISAFAGDGVFDSISKGIGGMISSFFSGEGQFDQLVEDLKAFDQVNADAIFKVGTGLSSFKDFMAGELNLDNVPKLKEAMAGIAEFSGDDVNIGNIQFTSDGLRNLQDVTNGLDSESIFSYNNALKELIETLKKLNEELGDQAGTEAGNAAQQAAQLAIGNAGTGTGGADKIDQLNTTMQNILAEIQLGNKTGVKTYKATKANSDAMW